MKIKFGRNLLILIVCSFFVFFALGNNGPQGLQIILGGLCFISSTTLWIWALKDYFNHRGEFTAPMATGILLLLTGWIGAVVYYFKIILPRERGKA